MAFVVAAAPHTDTNAAKAEMKDVNFILCVWREICV
jgi:hypothetical protein